MYHGYTASSLHWNQNAMKFSTILCGWFGLYNVVYYCIQYFLQNNAWGCNAICFLCLWTHWMCGQPDPGAGNRQDILGLLGQQTNRTPHRFLYFLQPWSLLQSPMVCCHLTEMFTDKHVDHAWLSPSYVPTVFRFRELEKYMIWFWSRIEPVVRMRLCSKKSKWAKETALGPAESLSYCCIFMSIMLKQPSEKSINSL